MSGRRMDPTLARSWLLVPALTREALQAAEASSVDAIILDLEDGVPAASKAQARAMAVDWLQDHNAWVRINDVTTTHWLDDIRALAAVVDEGGGADGESGVRRVGERARRDRSLVQRLPVDRCHGYCFT